jgi:hypothetical protein
MRRAGTACDCARLSARGRHHEANAGSRVDRDCRTCDVRGIGCAERCQGGSQAGRRHRLEPDDGRRTRDGPDAGASGDADRGDRAVVGLRCSERHRAEIRADPRAARGAAWSLQEGGRRRGRIRGACCSVPRSEANLRRAAGCLAGADRRRGQRPIRWARPRLGEAGRRRDPGLASWGRHLGDPSSLRAGRGRGTGHRHRQGSLQRLPFGSSRT